MLASHRPLRHALGAEQLSPTAFVPRAGTASLEACTQYRPPVPVAAQMAPAGHSLEAQHTCVQKRPAVSQLAGNAPASEHTPVAHTDDAVHAPPSATLPPRTQLLVFSSHAPGAGQLATEQT